MKALPFAIITVALVATSTFVDSFGWEFGLGIAAFLTASIAISIAFLSVKRWYGLRDPCKVTYLVPQKKYPEREFPDAEERERWPKWLRVGIGKYRIMHRITPRMEFECDGMTLQFVGPERNRPKAFGRDNPFIVRRRDSKEGVEYTNWWGQVLPTVGSWPRHFLKGRVWVIGNQIETYGPWIGDLVLTVPIRGYKAKEYALGFTVDEANDEAPFLKGWSDE